ncbi:MAG TPA: hydrolase [Anaerolineae bacterium]|nr:hydrolase [Anaerolineae bacterium]
MSGTSAPHGNLINREDSVLVVIDVQERLMPVISSKDQVIDNVVRLLKFSRIVGVPVILTEQEKLGDTLHQILEAGPDIQPIRKLDFDCFGCQGFLQEVHRIGRNTLILIGVETHICVAQTALHAVPDYTVHVVSDATSSRREQNWKVTLERMRQVGVVVTSTEMVIYELLQRAGTDEFRATLPLVK